MKPKNTKSGSAIRSFGLGFGHGGLSHLTEDVGAVLVQHAVVGHLFRRRLQPLGDVGVVVEDLRVHRLKKKKTNGRSLVIVLLLHLKLLIIFPFQIRTLQIRVIIQVRGIAPRTGSGPRKVFECKGMWPVHFRKRKLLTKIKIPVRALISGMESSLSCISSQSTFLELSHFQLCSVF